MIMIYLGTEKPWLHYLSHYSNGLVLATKNWAKCNRTPCSDMEQTLLIPFFPDPDSDVRLVDGPGRCQGRVEVLHQGQWSTVCKAGWNLRAAKVVCRQLGCGRALLTHSCCNKMTQGKGPIWMRQMSCSGQEANLQDCPLRPLENNCTHDEDTWMECEGNGRWWFRIQRLVLFINVVKWKARRMIFTKLLMH